MKRKYYRDAELGNLYRVSRRTIWRWVEKGFLPQPIRFPSGSARWDSKEIEKFDAERRSAA